MLGFELLPFSLTGLEVSLVGGNLRLLGAGQHAVVDLGVGGSFCGDAGSGELTFSLSEACSGSLIARRARRQGFERLALLVDGLELRLKAGEFRLLDLLDRRFLCIREGHAAEGKAAVVETVVAAVAAETRTRTTLSKGQRGTADSRSQDDRQSHCLAHSEAPAWGLLLVII
jgi:hypothetical protein